jgi:CubicO group peptidase (beta-lactamase class C family)
MSGFDIIEPVSELDENLKRYIRQQMTELQIPGVAVGMAYGDAIAVGGFGVTSIENPLSVNGDTVFQLGSITKTITGTAIMQLVDEGSLDLDRPVQDYLPDFRVADPEISKAVTVRHLMTHTVGWEGDIFEAAGWGDDALSILVGRLAKLKQVTPFGTLWSYSNASFYVLGRILEVHYGKPYENIIQEQLFAPLGIRHACYFAHDVVLERFSVGHAIGPSGLQVARPWAMERSSSPVGTTMMNVKDLLRYARFHLGTLEPSSPILKPETKEQMRRPGMPGVLNGAPSGLAGGMGLSFMLGDRAGARVAGHGGSANGQPADLSMLPDHGFAVVVLTNLQNPGHTLAKRIVRWAHKAYFGIEVPAPEPAPFGDLDEAIGTYDTYGGVLEVRREGDELRVDSHATRGWLDNMDPPTPAVLDRRFVPIGNDKVAALPLEDENIGTFLRDDSGNIKWFLLNHRAALRR